MRTPRSMRLLAAMWLAMAGATFTRDADAQSQVLQPIRFLKKTIEVHVQDTEGRPISEFEYTMSGPVTLERRADGSLPQFKHVSDPLGVARIELRPYYRDGVWKVTIAVGAPGRVTTFHTIEPEKLTETVVVLERAGRVFGKVIDSAGNPIAGALVWLGDVPRYWHHGPPAHIMESDSTGGLESDRIPTGQVHFGIAHPDFIPNVYERQIALDRMNRLSFVMVGAATLQGSLLFGSQPADDADVVVFTGDLEETKVSDYKRANCQGGAFVVKGIVPGTNQVNFRAFQPRLGFKDRVWTLTDRITFAEKDNRKIETRIPTGTSSLAGKLMFGGAPMAGGLSVYVTLMERDSGRALKIGMPPNAGGDYAFDSVPAGTWSITARAWDDEAKKLYQIVKEIPLAKDESLRLNLDLPEVALESQ